MLEVVRMDRDDTDKAWAASRFEAMTVQVNSVWEIAQDIEANWVDGRDISRFYPDEWTPSMAMREHYGRLVPAPVEPAPMLIWHRLREARIQRRAPEQYRGLPPTLYHSFKDSHTTADIERYFKTAEKRKGGITRSNMRSVLGLVKITPLYWPKVITAAMEGDHGLTPEDARNLIATLQHWLEQQVPGARARR